MSDDDIEEAERMFLRPINPDPLTDRIKELEEEVKHLKRELAARATPVTMERRPPSVVPKFDYRPYSKETQAGRKKKQK